MIELKRKWTPARDDATVSFGLPSEHCIRTVTLDSDRVGRTYVDLLCGKTTRLFARDALDEPTGSAPSCNTCLLIERRAR
jgi:hypothetical protein